MKQENPNRTMTKKDLLKLIEKMDDNGTIMLPSHFSDDYFPVQVIMCSINDGNLQIG
jgi:hypothetical protein